MPMKTWTALALLLILGGVSARAEDNDKVATLRGEIELSEIERDVDKELLREAMMLAGRARMRETADRTDSVEARKRSQAESDALEVFIQTKKVAVVERTAELKKKASEVSALEKSAAIQRVTRPNQPVKPIEG